jgi:FKBP-type peptidyl-prolyl cis-trans isomerase
MKHITFTFIFLTCVAIPCLQAQKNHELEAFLNGKYYKIDYKIHKHHGHHRRILKKDYVTFHIETRNSEGKTIKSTFGHKPIVKEISNDDYLKADKGFLEDILLTLHKEDSATFWIPEYMLFQAIKHQRPKMVKAGSTVAYIIKVLKVQNKEEAENDKNQVIFDQRKKDEKAIAEYVAKNKLTNLKKTYSGIWYTMENEGEGENAQKGDVVALKYVGKFLDGTVFGSSDDDGRLFEFPVAEKFAIEALDEMLVLMKKGSKCTFITPCYLAYKEQGMAKIVPPNTPLVFEIEYVEIVCKKIVIENKGEIMEKERKKSEEDKVLKTLQEKQKDIDKDAEKRGLLKKNN